MADTLTDLPAPARTPLAHWNETFAALAPAVHLVEAPVAAVIVRTDDPGVIASLNLPGACTIRRAGGETAIWLGPDEWLLTRPGLAGHQYLREVTERIGVGALSASPQTPAPTAYLADATGQRTQIILGGEHATTILAHGCAIDLDPAAFGPGDVAQTLLAQAGIILHRTESADPDSGAPSFALYVRSSFADYLAGWLVDATIEYRT